MCSGRRLVLIGNPLTRPENCRALFNCDKWAHPPSHTPVCSAVSSPELHSWTYRLVEKWEKQENNSSLYNTWSPSKVFSFLLSTRLLQRAAISERINETSSYIVTKRIRQPKVTHILSQIVEVGAFAGDVRDAEKLSKFGATYLCSFWMSIEGRRQKVHFTSFHTMSMCVVYYEHD